MPRKKKVTTPEVKEEENTKVEQKSNFRVGYSGSIKVSIAKKNKVISSKVYKNAGRYPLFQFFAECLKGDYRSAEMHRPVSIVIYSVPQEKTPTITDESQYAIVEKISTYCNYNNKISYGAITYKNVPEISINTSSNLGSAAVKYIFNVPFSQLATPSDGRINLIALYDGENRQNYENPSAFFFVVDEQDNSKLGSLISGLDLDADVSNYSLIIEWTLKLGNDSTGK